jgi:hypothetical protein
VATARRAVRAQTPAQAAATTRRTGGVGTDNATDGTGETTTDGSTEPNLAKLDVSPSSLNFGYNKLGTTSRKTVTLTNTLKRSEGASVLTINSVAIEGDVGGVNMYRLAKASLAAAGPLPWFIAPEESVELDIEYTPLTETDHISFLVIDSSDDAKDANRYPLVATYGIKPVCTFEPEPGSTIDFGQIPEQTTTTRPFVIANRGGENCVISAAFNPGSDPAFTLTPAAIPDIGPGGQATKNIVFAPSATGTYQATLTFLTNDPTAPEATYTLTGEAVEKLTTDVLKIQFAAKTPIGNLTATDFRVADLTYTEAFSGRVVSNTNQSPNWTDIGGRDYGQPKWTAQGFPYPIVVWHADYTIDDGCFHVGVDYVQDCSYVANQGGICVGLGCSRPFGVDPGAACVTRAALDVTVRADVNGQPVDERSITLDKKGDTTKVFTIRRRAGLFKVDSYNPGLCNVP